MDSGSEKVQRHLGAISHRNKITKVTMECTTKISTDLERAPGARSIAVEFFVVHPVVTKLQRCENTGFHFHAAPFGTRSPLMDHLGGGLDPPPPGDGSSWGGGPDPLRPPSST